MKCVRALGPAVLLSATAFGCAAGENASEGFGGSDAAKGLHEAGAPDAPRADVSVHLSEGGATSSCKGKPNTCAANSFTEIVDCNGSVVRQCGTDEGCKDGECVSACDAVAATETTLGCEYYTHVPDTEQLYGGYGLDSEWFDGGCFALIVVNSWNSDMILGLEHGGLPIPNATSFTAYTRIVHGSGSGVTYDPVDSTGKIHAGEVAVVFLVSADPESWMTSSAVVGSILTCPEGITPALVETIQPGSSVDNGFIPYSKTSTTFDYNHGTQIRPTFHLKTSVPATVYDVYPFGAGGDHLQLPGSSLLLPVASWTKNYITVDPAETFFDTEDADAWISIVAAKDNTHITIVPPVDIPSFGDIAGARANVPFTYTLQSGQALEIAQGPEFAGAPIASDQPIAVFGGHECLILPDPAKQASYESWFFGVGCDAAHQQIPPLTNWGFDYFVAPFLRATGDAMVMRMAGAVNGTVLKYSPSLPDGAPTTLDNGQVADFLFSSAFYVSSQDTGHPFYATRLMTNCEESGTTGSACGDPEFVNAIPPEQFIGQYTLFADPSYANLSLELVEERNTSGMYDDISVDCLGAAGISSASWSEVGSFRHAIVPLRSSGMPVGACDAGVHTVTSASRFGLTVWGLGDHTSYAYTPAMGTKALTTVVAPVTPK